MGEFWKRQERRAHRENDIEKLDDEIGLSDVNYLGRYRDNYPGRLSV